MPDAGGGQRKVSEKKNGRVGGVLAANLLLITEEYEEEQRDTGPVHRSVTSPACC